MRPLAGLATTVEVAMARHRVPGCAVAVIAEGRLDWTRGYGVTASARDAAPVGIDTLFQACSISKAVAATAALRLVQAGRLDLDADVNDALTTWQVPANDGWQPRVTLRQLLSHTAGLTYCWYPGYRRDAALPTTLDTLLGQAPANTPPVRVTALPGTQFRYSGSHYAVLQQLLMDVTDQSFEALLRELVLAPLGMRDSGYEVDFPARHPGATASGHDAGGAPIADGWRLLPESAGAGLWTTPTDLCRLACAVSAAWSGETSDFLSQETARRMLTAQLGGWGLGWTVETVGGGLRDRPQRRQHRLPLPPPLLAGTGAGRGGDDQRRRWHLPGTRGLRGDRARVRLAGHAGCRRYAVSGRRSCGLGCLRRNLGR